LAKQKIAFFCSACGAEYAKWQGRCDQCSAWHSLEEAPVPAKKQAPAFFVRHKNKQAQLLSEIAVETEKRIRIGVGELDNLFGGGLLPASLNLLGGGPGIGKSTLLLQMLNRLTIPALYVSGEESPGQIKQRAERLGINGAAFRIYCENDLQQIQQQLERNNYRFLVIDSIQAVYHPDVDAAPGQAAQIRAVGHALLEIAKLDGITIFVSGHITKDGALAGPRLLEHIVDTVFFFEEAENTEYRFLRAFKNRFGSVNEIAVFKMTERGLVERQMDDWLGLTVASKAVTPVITTVVEGSRAFALEVQALVATTQSSYPQRVTTGCELRRLHLLVAVCERHLNVSMANRDIFVKLSGGFHSKDASLDLAIVAALLTAQNQYQPQQATAFLGEVDLNGRIRPLRHAEKRLQELKRNGIKKIIANTDVSIQDKQTMVIVKKHISELFIAD
jgi:DNA repair protein RadA/Sms